MQPADDLVEAQLLMTRLFEISSKLGQILDESQRILASLPLALQQSQDLVALLSLSNPPLVAAQPDVQRQVLPAAALGGPVAALAPVLACSSEHAA